MKTRITLALALVTLGLAATSASANRISVDDERFRITWAELTFSLTSGERISCAVTLSGSYHQRTFSKNAHALLGFVQGATMGACTRGTVTFLARTLPWHVTYESFSGTLPNITEFTIGLIGVSFETRGGLGLPCLATTTTTEPALFTAVRRGGPVTQFIPQASAIDLVDTTGSGCDAFGFDVSLSGTGTVTDGFGELLRTELI